MKILATEVRQRAKKGEGKWMRVNGVSVLRANYEKRLAREAAGWVKPPKRKKACQAKPKGLNKMQDSPDDPAPVQPPAADLPTVASEVKKANFRAKIEARKDFIIEDDPLFS